MQANYGWSVIATTAITLLLGAAAWRSTAIADDVIALLRPGAHPAPVAAHQGLKPARLYSALPSFAAPMTRQPRHVLGDPDEGILDVTGF